MRVDGLQSSSYQVNTTSGQGSREISTPEIKQVQNTPQERNVEDQQLNKALEKANKSFQPFDRQFQRSYHEKTNAVMVKVIDSSTGDLIRELPPEKILDMVAHMLEVAGILVDKRV